MCISIYLSADAEAKKEPSSDKWSPEHACITHTCKYIYLWIHGLTQVRLTYTYLCIHVSIYLSADAEAKKESSSERWSPEYTCTHTLTHTHIHIRIARNTWICRSILLWSPVRGCGGEERAVVRQVQSRHLCLIGAINHTDLWCQGGGGRLSTKRWCSSLER